MLHQFYITFNASTVIETFQCMAEDEEHAIEQLDSHLNGNDGKFVYIFSVQKKG